MATDPEIEATRRLSVEIESQTAELVRQAKDPARSLAGLFDSADKEFGRLIDVLKKENPPAGTGSACFEAAVTLIGDWSEMEVAALQGMDEADAGPKSSKTGSVNRGARRGMRI